MGVKLSDEVKEFIVKTIKEEISRILPLTVVTKEDLRMAIDMLNKRFEDLQKYLDKRFEAVDRRFEAVDRRFDSLVRLLQIIFIVISLLIAVFGFLGMYIV